MHKYLLVSNYIIMMMIIKYSLKSHWVPMLSSQTFFHSSLMYTMTVRAPFWSIFKSFTTRSFRLVLGQFRGFFTLHFCKPQSSINDVFIYLPYTYPSYWKLLVLVYEGLFGLPRSSCILLLCFLSCLSCRI